jgi:hypothetical protein
LCWFVVCLYTRLKYFHVFVIFDFFKIIFWAYSIFNEVFLGKFVGIGLVVCALGMVLDQSGPPGYLGNLFTQFSVRVKLLLFKSNCAFFGEVGIQTRILKFLI